ncbi:MAG: hypothetical protein U0X39_04260 [Bacteroidales bacterium]
MITGILVKHVQRPEHPFWISPAIPVKIPELINTGLGAHIANEFMGIDKGDHPGK